LQLTSYCAAAANTPERRDPILDESTTRRIYSTVRKAERERRGGDQAIDGRSRSGTLLRREKGASERVPELVVVNRCSDAIDVAPLAGLDKRIRPQALIEVPSASGFIIRDAEGNSHAAARCLSDSCRLTPRFQPRRRMVAPAAAGCRSLLAGYQPGGTGLAFTPLRARSDRHVRRSWTPEVCRVVVYIRKSVLSYIDLR